MGFDTGKRDINRAKCAIKLCCFRDHHFDTCADCPELATCTTIGDWYAKNGYKYKKYQQAIDFIRQHGYEAFIKCATDWKNAYGKLD